MTRCTLCVVVLCAAVVSCGDSVKQPPQSIEADGQTFIACRDNIYISNEGGGVLGGGEITFRIKFSDQAGRSHVIKGVRKLHVSELPGETPACQPTR